MLYPLKFRPVFKDYIWGGRNLSKLNKALPEGITAESWEISCHPDGISTIANGEFEGLPLTELIAKYGQKVVGNKLPEKAVQKFPLLVKFIDANDKLSVQVHPDDAYANKNENGEYGKNEMWYILSAKEGAKIIYDLIPGTDKDKLSSAIKCNSFDTCFKCVEVSPGDVINIPSGVIHALCEGVVLAEIQQNSNTTYRVYDYDRVDKNGNKRPLHVEKALDVIDFDSASRPEKITGISLETEACRKQYLIANSYFAIEQYDINTEVSETADGGRFYIYVFTHGNGSIEYSYGEVEISVGDSVLIPACLGSYKIKGNISALKAYVPDITQDFLKPLMDKGYSEEEIRKLCSVDI